jgi:hypothetical protein
MIFVSVASKGLEFLLSLLESALLGLLISVASKGVKLPVRRHSVRAVSYC